MRKTKSPILEAVHDTAKTLHKAGVMDQVTLREFDQLCLPLVEPLQPEQIKHIRETTRVSQAVFARLPRARRLVASTSTDLRRAETMHSCAGQPGWGLPLRRRVTQRAECSRCACWERSSVMAVGL
jgi:DNA-binding transcriptional regulator YiaG